MIDVYSWPTPNGHKIHIMLEETGLEYRVHPVNIATGEQFSESFLKISPNNKIPAIVDPEGPKGRPYSLFESGAILHREEAPLYFEALERERVIAAHDARADLAHPVEPAVVVLA